MTSSNTALGEHDHGRCVARVMAAVEARAAQTRARLTPVRRRALEILLESHAAIGAYELLERLREEGFGGQPPVAYRALDFLVKQGFAHRIEKMNAFVACMSPECAHDPVFMICRKCRSVAETTNPGEATLAADAASQGFEVERMVVEIEGLCPLCRSAS